MARILLADDDKPTRDLVKRALESDGHVVEIVQDGTEALESLSSHGASIEILVTDVNMPGLDGISLANDVRLRRRAGAREGLVHGARLRSVKALHARPRAQRRARSARHVNNTK